MAHPVTPVRDALPAKYHALFRHPMLNAVQSAVAADVLRSDRNLVIASPTASGKTGVFELALIRMLEMRPGGKALFLAPMKAICAERLADWSARFSPHGIDVMMLTSDSDAEDADGVRPSPYDVVKWLEKATLIVATTEKWDVWTRTQRSTNSVIGQICLLCVDEVHMLGESRGPVIEAVVARMRTISSLPDVAQLPIAKLRVVVLSATIPNPETLCEWLGAERTIVRTFDASFRPTPLSLVVSGYRQHIAARFEVDMLLPALPSVIRKHSRERPTLVFMASRKGAVDAALQLAKANMTAPSDEATAAAADPALRGSHELAKLLRSGVAYHLASMSAGERRIVELLFAEGHLSVLCATTGLSLGVNLPAHLVVICGTQRYNGSTSGYVDYSNSDILQMAGRAGRPQFDTEGVCVVMTSEASTSKYLDILAGVRPVASQLHKQLVEHLNSEINTASYMTSVSVALSFVQDTYLYKCVLDPNLRHNFGIARDADLQEVDQQVHSLCLNTLRRLDDSGLIRLAEDGQQIEPLGAGRIMARYAVCFESMALITSKLSAQTSVEELLDLLSHCEELQDVLRRSERKPLFELNKISRYPIMDAKLQVAKVGDAHTKTNVLLQARCSGDAVDSSLLVACKKAADKGVRLLTVIMELAQERGYFTSLLNAHWLSRCIARGAGWGESAAKELAQLPGIGEVLADRLAAAGIKSIAAVSRARPAQLETSCFKSAPFGSDLIDKARRLPVARLWAQHDDARGEDSGDTVSVGVICSRAPSHYDPRSPDGRFTLLVGQPADGTLLLLRRNLKLAAQDQSMSFRIGAQQQHTQLAGRLRICLLHEHYIGADVETQLGMPCKAGSGAQVDLELRALICPAAQRAQEAPLKRAAKTAAATQSKRPEKRASLTPPVERRARAADDIGEPVPTARASSAAPSRFRPAADVMSTPQHRGATSSPDLQLRGPQASRAAPPEEGADSVLDAFFEQFSHGTGGLSTPGPSQPPADAYRRQQRRKLTPPTLSLDVGPSVLAPRLLGNLARTSASAGDLIAGLRSTISMRTPPPVANPRAWGASAADELAHAPEVPWRRPAPVLSAPALSARLDFRGVSPAYDPELDDDHLDDDHPLAPAPGHYARPRHDENAPEFW